MAEGRTDGDVEGRVEVLEEGRVEEWLDQLALNFAEKGTPRSVFSSHWHDDPWAQRDLVFVIRDPSGTFLSTARVFPRRLSVGDGPPLYCGGLGEVSTHPHYRRRGLGERVLHHNHHVVVAPPFAMGLLHASRHTVQAFYAARGWQSLPLRVATITLPPTLPPTLPCDTLPPTLPPTLPCDTLPPTLPPTLLPTLPPTSSPPGPREGPRVVEGVWERDWRSVRRMYDTATGHSRQDTVTARCRLRGAVVRDSDKYWTHWLRAGLERRCARLWLMQGCDGLLGYAITSPLGQNTHRLLEYFVYENLHTADTLACFAEAVGCGEAVTVCGYLAMFPPGLEVEVEVEVGWMALPQPHSPLPQIDAILELDAF